MENKMNNNKISNMEEYCKQIKRLIQRYEYKESENQIMRFMIQNPHSAIPHNLLGILYEKENNHILAMKHFRASYALDPTYIPARYNMSQYGTLDKKFIKEAYCEDDCVNICKASQDKQFVIKYDEHHVGYIERI